MLLLALLWALLAGVAHALHLRMDTGATTPAVPISVNYHVSRLCNYGCKYCFHTALSSERCSAEEARRGLVLLAAAGMRKLNFAGGEPLLLDRGDFVGDLVAYAKEQLGIECVSIITNGSLMTESWFRRHGTRFDVFGVSCDSFDAATNRSIGRFAGGSAAPAARLARIRDWCEGSGALFKINTVVSAANAHEDMRAPLLELRPARWKVFQCLLLEGENAGGVGALRDAAPFTVPDAVFAAFGARHAAVPGLVLEPRQLMRDSYLILDERMRFLNCAGGGKRPGESLLEVGVEAALAQAGFDADAFHTRGGVYDWSRGGSGSGGGGGGSGGGGDASVPPRQT
ncbi:hypothetical protein JKP88DRAFT_171564 [Tribonema minus]|uniref:Radical SAM core domain-containing protein n=1 Tax=Tribonema minus TaxID=303371 RepID=A0A836C839_9STRA|nr:hypothetical protein JKP88DRAFT_171564 [Tribonema minus]